MAWPNSYAALRISQVQGRVRQLRLVRATADDLSGTRFVSAPGSRRVVSFQRHRNAFARIAGVEYNSPSRKEPGKQNSDGWFSRLRAALAMMYKIQYHVSAYGICSRAKNRLVGEPTVLFYRI